MRLAITAKGKDLSAELDPRFGRAAYILFYDTDTKALEVVDNSAAAGQAHGAGVQAAREVIDRKADALLTPHCGPSAFEAMKAAKVKVFDGLSGTVGEAIERFLAGELQEATGPNPHG